MLRAYTGPLRGRVHLHEARILHRVVSLLDQVRSRRSLMLFTTHRGCYLVYEPFGEMEAMLWLDIPHEHQALFMRVPDGFRAVAGVHEFDAQLPLSVHPQLHTDRPALAPLSQDAQSVPLAKVHGRWSIVLPSRQPLHWNELELLASLLSNSVPLPAGGRYTFVKEHGLHLFDFTVGGHAAQLVVRSTAAESLTRAATLSRFTSLLSPSARISSLRYSRDVVELLSLAAPDVVSLPGRSAVMQGILAAVRSGTGVYPELDPPLLGDPGRRWCEVLSEQGASCRIWISSSHVDVVPTMDVDDVTFHFVLYDVSNLQYGKMHLLWHFRQVGYDCTLGDTRCLVIPLQWFDLPLIPLVLADELECCG